MIRRRFLALVSSWLPRRDIIDDAGTLYLSRFLVLGDMMARRVPFTVYLHRFHRPDEDRGLHNHPWPWAVSLILTGGYAEHRRPEPFFAHSPDGKHTMRVSMGNLTQARWLRAGSLNFLHGDTFHRVAELDGETWTLFVVGRKKQPWGFDVPGRGFVPGRVREAEARAARAGQCYTATLATGTPQACLYRCADGTCGYRNCNRHGLTPWPVAANGGAS